MATEQVKAYRLLSDKLEERIKEEKRDKELEQHCSCCGRRFDMFGYCPHCDGDEY